MPLRTSPDVSSITVSSTHVVGDVTLAAGSNITLTPSGQTITIASSASGMSIGGTVTSGTAKSVLFVDAGPVLAQDNSHFQYDDTASAQTLSLLDADFLVQGSSTGMGQVSIQSKASQTPNPYAIVFDEATTNLIVNPSFEVNVTDGWSLQGSNSTKTQDSTKSWSGAHSMKIAVSPSTNNSGVVTSSITVSSNTQYILSYYIIGNAGGERIQTKAIGNVSGSLNSKGFLAYNTYWQRVILPFTTGASDSSVTIQILTNATITATWFIDAVQLEKNSNSQYESSSAMATSYCDGTLGLGYSWSGTAHNSTSSRTAGLNILSPISANTAMPFVINQSGEILTQNLTIRADSNSTNYAPFPVRLTGNFNTANIGGVSGSVVIIENEADGTGLTVTSNATADFGMIVSCPSILAGTVLGILAPADKTNMVSNGGRYFSFEDKSGKIDFYFTPQTFGIGAASENLNKYFIAYGGGKYSKTDTSQAGTVAQSTSTITGTGTSFTGLSIGDAITISSTVKYITNITSDTSMTVSDSTTVTAGTSYTSQTKAYSPFFVAWESPGGNHRNLAYTALSSTMWFDSEQNLKVKLPSRTSGAVTASTTANDPTITLSGGGEALTVGQWLVIEGQRPIQITVKNSNTSYIADRDFSLTLSGVGYEIINPNTVTMPAADTDGLHVSFSGNSETASAGPTASTSEVSLFSTAPTIEANKIEASRTIKITLMGTITGAATSTLTLKLKARRKNGSYTTLMTTNAEGVSFSSSGAFILHFYITNTSSQSAAPYTWTLAQKIFCEFRCMKDAADQLPDQILKYGTGSSSLDMRADTQFDVTAQFGTAAGSMSAEIKHIEYIAGA